MATNKSRYSFTKIIVPCFTIFMFMALFTLLTAQAYAGDAKEIKKDGRFIAYDDGTVLDTKTNLMWVAKDNGSDINWFNAKSYCEGYSGGGKSGWRMPTIDELGQLHSSGAYGSVITRTGAFVWSSETHGSEAALFFYNTSKPRLLPQSTDMYNRALPVRSGK